MKQGPQAAAATLVQLSLSEASVHLPARWTLLFS